jgi:hypothetical protein
VQVLPDWDIGQMELNTLLAAGRGLSASRHPPLDYNPAVNCTRHGLAYYHGRPSRQRCRGSGVELTGRRSEIDPGWSADSNSHVWTIFDLL